MPRTVLRYGLWLLHTPRGAQDPRVFYEDKRGDWPVSLQQRALGVRLHAPGVYGRGFARMGNWKGFYLTATSASPMRTTRELLANAKRNLGLRRNALHTLIASKAPIKSSTGYALISAPNLRFIRNPPFGSLRAIIYAKREKVDA